MSMLNAIGKLYGSITNLRNALYDRGIFRSYSLGAKTISIGNITTGGTGKTPLVAHVANILADEGEKVCILTRGYGRRNPRDRVLVSDGETVLVDARTGGDEPVELAQKLLRKAVVVADADRVSAAKWAKEKFGITVFVLDDGFQHRRAKRDLDIVCEDVANPSGKMIPAGRLREPYENLSRADVIVLARCELVQSIAMVELGISIVNPTAPIFRSRFVQYRARSMTQFLELGDQKSNLDPSIPSLAFCALGNPKAFFQSLKLSGHNLRASEAFRDHHYYSQKDINELESRAREKHIEALLTTVKDAVKLRGLTFSIPCFIIESQIEIENAGAFRDLIISS